MMSLLPLVLLSACSGRIEDTPAYQAACEGAPLQTVEQREDAMEKGYTINPQFHCIDRASFAAAQAQHQSAATAQAANVPSTAAPQALPNTAALDLPGSTGSGQRRIDATRFDAAYRTVLAVLSQDYLIKRSEAFCAANASASSERIADAARNWRQRNAPAVDQARRVASNDMTTADRYGLDAGAREAADFALSRPLGASPERQAEWCDASAQKLADGTLDVGELPELAGR